MPDLYQKKQIEIMKQNLSSIRKIAGWTAKQLGEKIGVTKQTISNLENDKTDMTMAQYIALRAILDYELQRNTENKALAQVVELLFNNDRLSDKQYKEITEAVRVIANSSAGSSKETLHTMLTSTVKALGMAVTQPASPAATAHWLKKLLSDKRGDNFMSDTNINIEKRLQNMKNFYNKAEQLIENIPEAIPENVRSFIKDSILGDTDLKKLMEGIDSHRPPRILMTGRTGFGKSALINAMCGSYVAKVSDTVSCTRDTEIYQCKDNDRVLMEILDTRGTEESMALSDTSAEQQLIEQINEFTPDVAILVLNCTHRDGVDDDAEFMKNVARCYEERNKMRLPVVVVVNKCDEMADSWHKKPAEYPASKIKKINEVVSYFKEILLNCHLKIDDIIAVSSLIGWQTADGIDVGVEEIECLPLKEVEGLKLSFDGRYNIDKLLDVLEKSIIDFEAQMGLKMATRLEEVVRRIAKKLKNIFSGISAAVATSPIPISDIYILLILQAFLVTMIAALSGRDMSLDAAKEFIFSMGGVTGAGFVFKIVAQQASKLLNIIPGAGSVISATIASAGTAAIGEAAIAYYIDGKNLDAAKKKFEEAKAEK